MELLQKVSSTSDLKSLRYLLQRFIRPYWKVIVVLAGANAVVGLLISMRPLLIAPALEVFVGTHSVPAAVLTDVTLNNVGATMIAALGLDRSNILLVGLFVAICYVVFSVVIAGLGFAAYIVTLRTRTHIHGDMMAALHSHLLTLPFAYFHQRRAGDLVSRLSHYVAATSSGLDAVVRTMLQAGTRILLTAFILFHTDALFALSVLVLGSSHLLITRVLSKRVKQGAKEFLNKLGTVNASLYETFSSIRLIKSFAAEKYDETKIANAIGTMRKYEIRVRIARQVGEPMRIVADAVVVGVVLMLAFYAVSQGRLTLPAAAMFFYLSQQLLGPISDFANQLLGLHQTVGGATHVLEMFETKSALKEGRRDADKIQDRIEFKAVDFAYDPARVVLSNLNLTIKQGEMVALVGPSGAGKSTFADLVLRFYDPVNGVITYDGTDIREFRQASYRRNFGVVAQESLLFNTTVRENIVYNRAANNELLGHAVWVANAEEFIQALPDGLDTMVGDRGVRLSGGQKQRVAIARAIYGQPSILVLDEATSALDSESERAVQEAINRIIREVTTIVIAHRLSTITHADKIVVLNQGKIEAIGPHHVVLETSPMYRKLCRLQFAGSDSALEMVTG